LWENLPVETQKRCHFFNSFFYKKLTEDSDRVTTKQSSQRTLSADGNLPLTSHQLGFERVRKWTRVISPDPETQKHESFFFAHCFLPGSLAAALFAESHCQLAQ
jgi:hypothetical protein